MDDREFELARLKEENRHARQVHIVEAITRLALVIVQWGGLVAISYMIYLGVRDLAGKHTITAINLVGDIKISDAVLTLLSGGGLVYGLRQRKLRRDTIERLSERVSSYEKRVDSSRTSSQLTKRGTTPPEG